MVEIETVIGTKKIFEGRGIDLRVDQIRLPDGRQSVREIVEHPGSVCIVPINDAGEILMVRQFRLATGGPLLEVPAGGLEAGEDPQECAARELSEETGFAAAELKPIFSAYLAPGYSTELMHGFLATGLYRPQKAAQMDSDENIDLVSVPFEAAVEMIRRLEISDAKSIAAILAARLVRG
jgi:ADP-ribose pyrophosphatase